MSLTRVESVPIKDVEEVTTLAPNDSLKDTIKITLDYHQIWYSVEGQVTSSVFEMVDSYPYDSQV